jgi:hypothetical protein
MTSTPGRIYATAIALVTFFLFWAVIAAHPWAQPQSSSASSDPRLVALQAREQRLQARSVAVQKIVNRRWATYRVALAKRNKQLAAQQVAQTVAQTATQTASAVVLPRAPSVTVTPAAPVTATKTS